MASMLQAGLVGIPIVFLVLDQPEPYYVILVFLIFVICLATLLFMFCPKMQALKKWKGDQKRKAQRSGQDKQMSNNSTDGGEAGLKITRLRDSAPPPPLSSGARKEPGKKSDMDGQGASEATTYRSKSKLSDNGVEEIITMIEELQVPEEEKSKLIKKVERLSFANNSAV